MTDLKNKSIESTYAESLTALIRELPEEEQKALLWELTERQLKQRRKHPRKPYPMDVDYYDENEDYQNSIKNISISGAFIETDESGDLKVGQEITLTMPLADQNKTFKASGKIVRITSAGFGIKFSLKNSNQEF